MAGVTTIWKVSKSSFKSIKILFWFWHLFFLSHFCVKFYASKICYKNINLMQHCMHLIWSRKKKKYYQFHFSCHRLQIRNRLAFSSQHHFGFAAAFQFIHWSIQTFIQTNFFLLFFWCRFFSFLVIALYYMAKVSQQSGLAACWMSD